MLTGRGLIASITKAPPGQRAFAVVTCTDKVELVGVKVHARPLTGQNLHTVRPA